MEKEGLEFDETSPQELIETYKLLLEFKKKMKKKNKGVEIMNNEEKILELLNQVQSQISSLEKKGR